MSELGQQDPADVLFVCSLEDLNCLHDCVVAAMAGDDLSELPRLWNQQIGVIRSRPISHSSATAPELMCLPEEMPFDPDDIPQKKFVITDKELRLFFDAWMFSTKDAKTLTKLNDTIRNRVISIGHVSGCTCARCHTYKSSGYYLCEECYYKNDASIAAKAKQEEREKVLSYLEELVSSSVSDARKRKIIKSLRGGSG